MQVRAALAGIDVILAGQLGLNQIQADAQMGAVGLAIGQGLMVEPKFRLGLIR